MIIAIIPAKGYSKRLPNKNMRLLLGKPMLEYAIDYAEASNKVSRIYLSTDNESIAEFGKNRGVEVIIRSKDLGGETPLVDVYKHAIASKNMQGVNTIIGVQPDHPDRTVSLDKALKIFINDGLDLLYSKDLSGNKNGAHHIMSYYGLINNQFELTDFIIDDCTNIHYKSDLINAEKNLLLNK